MSQCTLTWLPDQDRQAIEAFRKHVSQTYPERVERMILFGSKARDDGHRNSDVDVLIVADTEDWRLHKALRVLAARLSLEYDVLLSPRIISRQRWDEMRRHRFTLYENVQADGIDLLHEEQSGASALADEELAQARGSADEEPQW